MANRHLARSIVMQTLFEWDFSGHNNDAALSALTDHIEEFAPGLEETEFMQVLLEGTLKKQKVIDEIITKAAPEWPLDKISAVDRNVLRLGLYELLFGNRDQVPPKVAINEAIELAKTYGGENSGKFINGVLGAVYKEIGEPGKDQTSPKKKQEEEINYDELPVDQKAGAVVYSIDDEGVIRFAMVHDVFGYWTLSKGGVEEGETAEQAAVREIKEEITLDMTIEEKLGENEYLANHPTRGKVRKHVAYFLGKSDYVPVKLEQDSGGLDDAKWFRMEEIVGLTMYDDITQLLATAIKKITKIK